MNRRPGFKGAGLANRMKRHSREGTDRDDGAASSRQAQAGTGRSNPRSRPMATPARCLVVVADDYGIGPETSRGILELAQLGVVTGTVLLVNSPHAEEAARRWRAARPDADLGWHPCLTMDSPVLRP